MSTIPALDTLVEAAANVLESGEPPKKQVKLDMPPETMMMRWWDAKKTRDENWRFTIALR